MRWQTLLAAMAAYLIGGALTFAVIRWLGKGDPEMAFIVGAILAIQVAAFLHRRTPGAENTWNIKLLLGAVLAVTAIALGLALHRLDEPFKFADISIGLSAVGAFVFPLVLFNTFWQAFPPAELR